MTAALHDLMTRTEGLPCRTDPELFFSTAPTARQYAARQCHRCPLLLACMRYALAADEQYGVWGGVDFEARAIGCGTDRGYRIHKRRGELPCRLCESAHAEAVEADRRQRLAEEHAAGGSIRGYWLHRRLEEEACVPCKRACARQSQERRDRVRAGTEGARSAATHLPAGDLLRAPQTPAQRLPLTA